MRKNQITELFACHLNMGQSSTDSETKGTSSQRNFYDPDREYAKRMLAYEMYGATTPDEPPNYGQSDQFDFGGGQYPWQTGDTSKTIDPNTGLPIIKKNTGNGGPTPQPRSPGTGSVYASTSSAAPSSALPSLATSTTAGPNQTVRNPDGSYTRYDSLGRSTILNPDGSPRTPEGASGSIGSGHTRSVFQGGQWVTEGSQPTGMPPVIYDANGVAHYDYSGDAAPSGGSPTSGTTPSGPTETSISGSPTRTGGTTTLGGRGALSASTAPSGGTNPRMTVTPPTGVRSDPRVVPFRSGYNTPVPPTTTPGGDTTPRPPITPPSGGPTGPPSTVPFYDGYNPPVPPQTTPPGPETPPSAPGTWGKGGASGNRNLAGGLLYGAYGGLMNSEGYSPAEQNAMIQEGMNAARAQYAGAQGQIARRTAATGNTAGYAAGLAALGRSEASTYGQQARQNRIDFAKEKERRRELGMQGMGGLYTGESNYLSGLMGQRVGLSAQPIGKLSNTQGSGNYLGTNFGLSVS